MKELDLRSLLELSSIEHGCERTIRASADMKELDLRTLLELSIVEHECGRTIRVSAVLLVLT